MGCDKPTDHPQYQIECPVCSGARCGYCDLTGTIVSYRCPNAELAEAPEVVRFVNFFNQFFEGKGILPSAGGWADQPATFLAAVEFYAPEQAAALERRRKRERATSEFRARAKNRN